MLRIPVLPIVVAIGVAAAGLARTHVHDYTEHEHPEHRHGPAVHSHAPRVMVQAPHAPGHRSMAACHAADHQVLVQAAAIGAKPFGQALPVVLVDATPAAEVRRSIPLRRADVRVHGPPPDRPSSPRAPPVVHPA